MGSTKFALDEPPGSSTRCSSQPSAGTKGRCEATRRISRRRAASRRRARRRSDHRPAHARGWAGQDRRRDRPPRAPHRLPASWPRCRSREPCSPGSGAGSGGYEAPAPAARRGAAGRRLAPREAVRQKSIGRARMVRTSPTAGPRRGASAGLEGARRERSRRRCPGPRVGQCGWRRHPEEVGGNVSFPPTRAGTRRRRGRWPRGSRRPGRPDRSSAQDQAEGTTMLKLLRNLAILRYIVRLFRRRG